MTEDKRRKEDRDGVPKRGEKPGRLQEALLENATLRQELALMRKAHQAAVLEAHSDPLTGLLNPRGLNKIIEAYDTEHRSGVVLALDMRRLKEINDTYGHDVGDEAIKTFAKRAKGALRESDIIARTGGDEFIVILPDTSPKESRAVRLRLKESLSNISISQGAEVGVRVGVARYDSKTSIKDALKLADKREAFIRENLRQREPSRYAQRTLKH